MKTFQEIYCQSHRCEPHDFHRKVFAKCLYPHAIVIAPFVHLANRRFFEQERELISRIGAVMSQTQLDAELKHFNDRRRLSWMQRQAGIRISTRRLARLGHSYLTASQNNRSVKAIGLSPA